MHAGDAGKKIMDTKEDLNSEKREILSVKSVKK